MKTYYSNLTQSYWKAPSRFYIKQYMECYMDMYESDYSIRKDFEIVEDRPDDRCEYIISE